MLRIRKPNRETTYYAYDSEDLMLLGMGKSEDGAIADLEEKKKKRDEIYLVLKDLKVFRNEETSLKLACQIAQQWDRIRKTELKTVLSIEPVVGVRGGLIVR